jgi:nitrite reductase (NADH) small subunit
VTAFVDVCASSQLPEGGRLVVEVNGKAVALARVVGVAWAIDNACPHRDGELGRGDLSGHHLYCPLHSWCFDVRTGRAFFPRGASVSTFEVSEKGGRISVATVAHEVSG